PRPPHKARPPQGRQAVGDGEGDRRRLELLRGDPGRGVHGAGRRRHRLPPHPRAPGRERLPRLAGRGGRAGPQARAPADLRQEGARVPQGDSGAMTTTHLTRIASPVFEDQVVEDNLKDGYWLVPVDVDGDGRPDLIASGLAE